MFSIGMPRALNQRVQNYARAIHCGATRDLEQQRLFWATDAYAIAASEGSECARLHNNKRKCISALEKAINLVTRRIKTSSEIGIASTSETEHAWLKWQIWMGMDEQEASHRAAFAKACGVSLYANEILQRIVSKNNHNPRVAPSTELVLENQALPTKVTINWSCGRVLASQAGFLKRIGRGLVATTIQGGLAESTPVRETLMHYALTCPRDSSVTKTESLRNIPAGSWNYEEKGAR